MPVFQSGFPVKYLLLFILPKINKQYENHFKKFKLAIIFFTCGRKNRNFNQIYYGPVLFKHHHIARADT